MQSTATHSLQTDSVRSYADLRQERDRAIEEILQQIALGLRVIGFALSGYSDKLEDHFLAGFLTVEEIKPPEPLSDRAPLPEPAPK